MFRYCWSPPVAPAVLALDQLGVGLLAVLVLDQLAVERPEAVAGLLAASSAVVVGPVDLEVMPAAQAALAEGAAH